MYGLLPLILTKIPRVSSSFIIKWRSWATLWLSHISSLESGRGRFQPQTCSITLHTCSLIPIVKSQSFHASAYLPIFLFYICRDEIHLILIATSGWVFFFTLFFNAWILKNIFINKSLHSYSYILHLILHFLILSSSDLNIVHDLLNKLGEWFLFSIWHFKMS